MIEATRYAKSFFWQVGHPVWDGIILAKLVDGLKQGKKNPSGIRKNTRKIQMYQNMLAHAVLATIRIKSISKMGKL